MAHIPAIMATVNGTEYDKVMGLDIGENDYLAKPFGIMEIVSRIKAVLRRIAGSVKGAGAACSAGHITPATKIHRGKIELHSVKDEGTTITIKFPRY